MNNDDRTPLTEPAGKAYWRSLNELADTPEFRKKLEREFENYDPDDVLNMSRRGFMKLAGASMALAGLTLTGCRRWPAEKLAPFSHRPEGFKPGVPDYYATMSEQGGVATGLLAKSFDGRPIKIEGNPQHPFSLGASDAWQQASVLNLYDPDRSRSVRVRAPGDKYNLSSWDAFVEFAQRRLKASSGGTDASDGDGKLAILSEPTASPSVARLRKAFVKKHPGAKWYNYDPVNRDNEIAGSKLVFKRPLRPVYDLSKAKIIACFDGDLLSRHPASLRYARDWANGRKRIDVQDKSGKNTVGSMSRLYVAEPAFTCTGSVADERLPIKSGDMILVLQALAADLGVAGIGRVTPPIAQDFVRRLLGDLKAARGESLLAVGPNQPPEVHALAWQINDKLGNLGHTITTVPEPDTGGSGSRKDDITELSRRMHAGEVETLVMFGGNPAHNAPADADFAGGLAKVQNSIHLAHYFNETSAASAWHLPRAHFLETWGDGRAWDGTFTLQQPLILPIFDGKSIAEVLAILLGANPSRNPSQNKTKGQDEASPRNEKAGEGQAGRKQNVSDGEKTSPTPEQARSAGSGAEKIHANGYDIVRATFRKAHKQAAGQPFERAWRRALHDGMVEGSAFKVVNVQPTSKNVMSTKPQSATKGFEVIFESDAHTYDGRFANNPWLQELPGPITKLTWGNAAWINIADAKAKNITNGQMIAVKVNGGKVTLPAYLMAGQARGTIKLPLGYGRTRAGRIGGMTAGRDKSEPVGVDVYPVRTSEAMNVATGASFAAAGGHEPMAMTQEHYLIDWVGMWGRRERVGAPNDSGIVIKEATVEEYKADPDFAHEKEPEDYHLLMFEPVTKGEAKRPGGPKLFNDPHAWGMSIDMSACTGCSACVIACQAENNIPAVGKPNVQMGREMQWLRIDRYFKTDPEADPNAEQAEMVNQPMMCVQCETAPCEEVCPVAATQHDTEGINVMVYNRCIGVRYCSNNCPYKVRRFNFFDWHSKPVRRDDALPWPGFADSEQREEVNALKQMVYNPDVTVRMRGVMEKCTYCTQRIERAKIHAKREWEQKERPDYIVQDGEIQTACQQACPTQAIVFGNLNDGDSRVSKLQKLPRSYSVLDDELDTRPRTQHLAKITNPVEEQTG